MKLEKMHPSQTEWKASFRIRKVGKWSYQDTFTCDGEECRYVKHYDTIMGMFVNTPEWGWTFEPWSVGHGSASDQQGMNKILRGEWSYFRNGGRPRYVAYDGVTEFLDR